MIDLHEGVLSEFCERAAAGRYEAVERWRLAGAVLTYTPDESADYVVSKRESEKRLKLQRLSQGLCPTCPAGHEQELARGLVRCGVCAMRLRDYMREYRSKQLAKAGKPARITAE